MRVMLQKRPSFMWQLGLQLELVLPGLGVGVEHFYGAWVGGKGCC